KKTTLFFVFCIFVLAYFLRVLFLSKNSLTFGYDQARDAYVSQQILKGDVKIQGPSASTPGLYHGVLYYYVLAPGYLLGHGSPIATAYWMAFLSSLTVFVVFYLGYLFSKKIGVGLLASFLFAISFETTQYATWLSNPTLGVLTVPLIYLGLWMWISKNRKLGPILAAVGLGFSVQSEIFLAYHLIPLCIWLFISRKTVTKKSLIIFGITFILSISTMIASEVKFGLRSFGGISALALGSGENLAYAKSIGDYLILYLNQIGRIFAFNSYPGNIGWGGTFVIVLAVYSLVKKDKVGSFLATWLFAHIWVVTVGGTSTPFLMAGIGPAVSLIIAYYLYKFPKPLMFFILAIIIFGNISMVLKENPKGSTLFSIQKDMLLSKQIAAIDYTYGEAKGEPFSVNSLTSPLYINIVWTYLYKWYGFSKYGYLPSWHGRDQVGQLDSLEKINKPDNISFLIIEPLDGIPPLYLDLTIGEEDSKTKLLDEKHFGTIRVQERINK
ncbi:MAG: hypothetical protein NTV24_00340, partial [Candidatus Woesebacteria bacterium]|nr:hypothetical protein [Candidatus Woesebacteria bacterium]